MLKSKLGEAKTKKHEQHALHSHFAHAITEEGVEEGEQVLH